MASRNFQLHGKQAELKLCDAANIDYPSEYFDVVYSNGVLHHTPDTIRCIGEAFRVLKPGGTFILSLYYKFSAFHIRKKIIVDGLFHGGFRKLGYDGVMATLEHGADGINIKPLVKTYSKKELNIILSDFTKVEISIYHFDKSTQLPYLHRFIPKWAERLLDKYLGWYVVGKAVK